MYHPDTAYSVRRRQEERERQRRAETREDLVLSLVAMACGALGTWAAAASAGEQVSGGEAVWIALMVVITVANALCAWASLCWLIARRRR
ncbi:MAG TPA: hypothetical protein VF202_01130 [Trueperaceae bacterium]